MVFLLADGDHRGREERGLIVGTIEFAQKLSPFERRGNQKYLAYIGGRSRSVFIEYYFRISNCSLRHRMIFHADVVNVLIDRISMFLRITTIGQQKSARF